MRVATRPPRPLEAEYDVPPTPGTSRANRQPTMPFAVLLEAALQPCGWLAAYLGSALTSPIDLSFRNLGGNATQYRESRRDRHAAHHGKAHARSRNPAA